MLDADERQEWQNNAGKIAEMAGIVWKKLLDQGIDHDLVHKMTLEWWKISIQPKQEFPDFNSILRGGDQEDLS